MRINPDTADFLSLSLMMKATPITEGARRFLFCEASDESLDAQGEQVMQKALSDSLEYFLARGNFDIDHITMTGAKNGIADYLSYEIGRPTEIKFHGDKTLVKGEIYSGTGVAAEKANQFWSSLTEINPPARWYPSVGGSVQASEVVIDPDTHIKSRKITAVRWSNIGFSKQPVNQQVQQVSTVSMDMFAKSWAANGFFTKTLEAGYGTDSASLTGAGAFRAQSLSGYEDYRNQVSTLLLNGIISARNLAEESIAHFGLAPHKATAWAAQFLTDLKHRRSL